MTLRISAAVAGLAAALLAGLAAALLAGPAAAQTCTGADTAVTQCRFVLSQPRDLTVVVRTEVATATPVSEALQISVDGRVCRRPRSSPFDRHTYVDGSCPLRLAAGEHSILAELSAQARGPDRQPIALSGDAIRPLAFEVTLAPSPRLDALPRETAELYSKPPAHHIWFWRF